MSKSKKDKNLIKIPEICPYCNKDITKEPFYKLGFGHPYNICRKRESFNLLKNIEKILRNQFGSGE